MFAILCANNFLTMYGKSQGFSSRTFTEEFLMARLWLFHKPLDWELLAELMCWLIPFILWWELLTLSKKPFSQAINLHFDRSMPTYSFLNTLCNTWSLFASCKLCLKSFCRIAYIDDQLLRPTNLHDIAYWQLSVTLCLLWQRCFDV